MTSKRDAPATARNREPILGVLAPLLADGSLVLEVASGTGQHAVYFATEFPHVTWQPTDRDAENLATIEAWRAESAPPNLRGPLLLDVISDAWPIDRADAVTCINMIHIAPWEACEGLIRGAARVLSPGGFLFLYGPYRVAGVLSPESNVAFDASLRGRNPAWGVRELDDVTALAASHGFVRETVTNMPANNLSVVFRRRN